MSRNRIAAADIATIAVGLMVVAAGVAVIVAGPIELMPVHYGLDGQADRWGGRAEVGGLITGLGVLITLVAGGIGLAAGQTEDPSRRRGLRMAQLVALMALLGVVLFAGGASLSGATSIAGGLPMAGLSVVLLASGAFLGRVAPNPFVGVRTPWAYKSRLAWDRSNRLAGRLMFVLGLFGLAASAVAPQPAGIIALCVGLLIAVLWAAVESWRVWRTDPDRQPF
ncbi:SdpI family protein [Brevundimonas lenta]|uniref:Putative membrane protein n=1 Tax=Brevundimonas lenta TaxID=424796 RepID=A0A7W6JC45_9CAUL|nr:SdpI family protein [Brevundimonas lenta]MBB4082405.1 putative membrane protein [Brevundimonas lenta]